MSGKRRHTTILLYILISLTIFSNYGYSRLNLNGSGNGYEEENPPSTTTHYLTAQSIEDLIVVGAGYYLASKENFESLISIVATRETNAPASVSMKESVRDSVTNIINAVETYKILVNKAESTPYRLDIIETLKEFDYETFGTENQLNADAFTEVANFLGIGNITGTFKTVSEACVQIESLLTVIKDTIDSGIVPGESQLDQLIEVYSRTTLFGSYVARVFHNIE